MTLPPPVLDPDPGAPGDPAANRGIALLRFALLPIALIELSSRKVDLPIDLYPFVVTFLAGSSIVLLVLAFLARARAPRPLTEAVLDLGMLAALVYTSGGAASPLRFAFYVMPIIAALRLSPMLTATWSALAVGAYLAVTVPHPRAGTPVRFTSVLDETLILVWVSAAAVMLSALVGRRTRAFAALAASRRRLVQQSLDAEARERRRLAQVLHDDAIQNVLLARQEVSDLARGVPGSADRARLALDETHRQLREEVFAMHPVGLERLGAAAVLQQLVDQAARRGNCEGRVHIEPAAAEVRNDLLYASARELLANAAKHARASLIEVSLDARDGELVLTVADNGVGIEPGRLASALFDGHIGLAAAAERIRGVGGDLTVDGADRHGTTVTATIPIDA